MRLKGVYYATIVAAFAISFFHSHAIQAQAILTVLDGELNNDGSVSVSIRANDLLNVALLQMGIKYDSNFLEYSSIDSLSTTLTGLSVSGNFGVPTSPNISNGQIRMSWDDPSGNGKNIPNGEILFRINFEILQGGSSCVQISNLPGFNIEIVDSNFEDIPVTRKKGLVVVPPTTIFGNVYYDLNNNCNQNAGEFALPKQNVIIQGTENFVMQTDSLGNYSLNVDPGTYDVYVYTANSLWQSCQNTVNVSMGAFASTEVNFGLQAQETCALPVVRMGASQFLPCESATINLTICNQGTQSASDYLVEVDLGNHINLVSASTAVNNVSGNLYELDDLDELEPGFCQNVQLNLTIDCTLEQDDLVCVYAQVSPPTDCQSLAIDESADSYCTQINTNNVIFKSGHAEDSSKIVAPGAYLGYTIHFMNESNQNLTDVLIEDLLSTALHLPSINFDASSHPFNWNLDGQRLNISMQGIDLAPQQTGFVRFSIRVNNNVSNGTIIDNEATVSLSQQPLITTNTESFEVIGTVSNWETNVDQLIQVKPNPVSEVAKVELPTTLLNGKWKIFDSSGRQIKTARFTGDSFFFRRDKMDPAVYILQVFESGFHIATRKFVVD